MLGFGQQRRVIDGAGGGKHHARRVVLSRRDSCRDDRAGTRRRSQPCRGSGGRRAGRERPPPAQARRRCLRANRCEEAISCRITSRSRASSSGSKRGLRRMSLKISSASPKSLRRRGHNRPWSRRPVAALRSPPTASISSAMLRALRRAVPLKAMCSRKCATPCSDSASLRLPAPIQRPSETVSTSAMAWLTTVRPFGKSGDCRRSRANSATGHRGLPVMAQGGSAGARLWARTKSATALKSLGKRRAALVLAEPAAASARAVPARGREARSTASGNLAGWAVESTIMGVPGAVSSARAAAMPTAVWGSVEHAGFRRKGRGWSSPSRVRRSHAPKTARASRQVHRSSRRNDPAWRSSSISPLTRSASRPASSNSRRSKLLAS